MNMPTAPAPGRERSPREAAMEPGTVQCAKDAASFVGCYELLDRARLAADIVEKYVHSHPACAQNQEWSKLAEQAVTALEELCRQVGTDQLASAKLRRITPSNDDLRALAAKLPPLAKWFEADEERPF